MRSEDGVQKSISPVGDRAIAENGETTTDATGDAATGAFRPGRRGAVVAGIVVAAAFGVFAGLGVFTFGFGQGHAYLGNDPQSCANCHVMQEYFDTWTASSHHAVAVCNDCHTPHGSLAAKYLTKADNGFFHSLAFTTGDFKDPIQIKPRNSAIVQASCLHCHQEFVDHMLPAEAGGDMLSCVHCHAGVGHAHTVAPRR